MMEKPAAFDYTVTSLLTSSNLPEASVTAGSATFNLQQRRGSIRPMLGMHPDICGDLWVLGH